MSAPANVLFLIPPKGRGRPIGREGQPIPAPGYFGTREHEEEVHGDYARVVTINSALADVRAAEPDATSVRVAEWVDAYLRFWDSLGSASPDRSPSDG